MEGAGFEFPECAAAAILEPDAAGVVSVEERVGSAVAVEGEIFDDERFDVFAADEGEEGGGGGFVFGDPEIVAEWSIEFPAVSGAGDEGSFDGESCGWGA